MIPYLRLMQNRRSHFAFVKAGAENATTIITSHRLSAIQHANIILYMENGTVAEKGTHEELMALRARYYEMYQLQQLEQLVERGGQDEAAHNQ